MTALARSSTIRVLLAALLAILSPGLCCCTLAAMTSRHGGDSGGCCAAIAAKAPPACPHCASTDGNVTPGTSHHPAPHDTNKCKCHDEIRVALRADAGISALALHLVSILAMALPVPMTGLTPPLTIELTPLARWATDSSPPLVSLLAQHCMLLV